MEINKAVLDRIFLILKESAKKNELITYQDLNIRLSPDGTGPFFDDIKELFVYLTKLSRMMKIRKRPLITVIVVDDDRRQPGTGFFKIAKQLDVFKADVSKKLDRKEFLDYETHRVFSFNW
ncbi:MAG: hypothetical protein C0601_11215 [Candidatus Muiribacterium halophilum]|uniref:Uncharacterized protein n=1 Tax=Muiribacterium halophilum TaxID=2053465 RepID=A0A2N5ZBY1_MUIH1|nr:MAG: hypothetical protein C0601_11215 [Candidatus Muirbacterium halophilum]